MSKGTLIIIGIVAVLMFVFASISFFSLESPQSHFDKNDNEAEEAKRLARENQERAEEAEQLLAREERANEEARGLIREKWVHKEAKRLAREKRAHEEAERLAREKQEHAEEAEQLAREKWAHKEAERLAREKQEHEKAKQTTHGDKSPVINNTIGDIVIEYPTSDHSCASYASENESFTNCSNQVDKEVAKLKKANIAFNSPSLMKKNKTYLINLHLSPNKSAQELLNKIKENEKESAEIKYSYRMKASLLSENKKAFEIMSISPDIQAISSILDTTTWKWDVTPLESGKQYLHLSLIAFLDLEDKETPLQIKTFDKEIEVKISVLDEITSFFQSSWKWLLGSLLFPLIVWYWKLKHPEKKS